MGKDPFKEIRDPKEIHLIADLMARKMDKRFRVWAMITIALTMAWVFIPKILLEFSSFFKNGLAPEALMIAGVISLASFVLMVFYMKKKQKYERWERASR